MSSSYVQAFDAFNSEHRSQDVLKTQHLTMCLRNARSIAPALSYSRAFHYYFLTIASVTRNTR